MNTVGDSAAVAVVGTHEAGEVVGYIFGGGQTDEPPLDTAGISCMKELCQHVESSTGQNLKVWNLRR